MPNEFVPVDIPYGQGMDDNTGRTALPSGKARSLVNGYFVRQGAITKRPGFSNQLGSSLGSKAELYNYGGNLLAATGGKLYSYSPAANSFVSAGTLRAVPTTSQVVVNSNVNISQCDSFSAGGFTITAWYDGTGTHAQIADDLTGEVFSLDTATFSLGTLPGYLQCYGVVQGGFTYLGYASSNNGTLTFRTFSTSGNSWNTTSLSASANISGFNIQQNTDPSDATAPLLLTFVYATSGLNATRCQWGWMKPNAIGTQQHGGTFTISSGGTTASTPLAALYVTGATPFLVVAFNDLANGPSLSSANFATPNTANGIWQVNSLVASANAGHFAFLFNSGTTYTLYFDVLSAVGTTQSLINAVQFSSSSGGFVAYPAPWQLGASLVSNWLTGVDGVNYAGIEYVSQVTASASPSALAAYPGLGSTATLNSALFVVDSSGNVCARVFRDSAMSQSITATLSTDVNGSLVLSARVLSKAEAATILSALALGGIGQLRFRLAAEYSSTSGSGSAGIAVTAFRESVTVGGNPMVFDNSAPAEENFHVYPECKVTFPTSTSLFSLTALTRYPAAYTTGQFVTGFGQSGFVSGSNASNGAGGHVYLVVVGGATNGTAPIYSVTGGKTVDGTCTLLDLGVATPLTFVTSQAAAAFPVGSVWVPHSGPNGYVYIVTGNSAAGTITEPTWTTTVGTTASGAGSSGGTVTFLCAAVYNVLTAQQGYTYQACYSRVDAQGQLHRSAASVPVGGQFTTNTLGPNANTALAITTYRLSAATNVRIEVYRTNGNGTVCQLIAILANDPTADYVGLVDIVPDTTQASGAILYQGQLGAGELANRPPQACTTIAVFGQRVFTNNTENPYELRPSKLITDGFGAAWADELPIQLNGVLGKLNALVQMDDKLILFQDYAISYLTGDGPDNTGGGANFTSPVPIATDVGSIDPASCLVTPAGVLFQSPKGIYLLDRGLNTSFVGEAVLNTVGSNFVIDCQIDPSLHQAIMVLSNNTLLVFDYQNNAWAKWTAQTWLSGGLPQSTPYSLGFYNGAVVVCDTQGNVVAESNSTYTDLAGNYALSVELAAEHLGGASSNAKVRGGQIIADSGGPTTLLVSTMNNYIDSASPSYIASDSPQSINGNAKRIEFRLPPPTRMSSLGVLVQEINPGSSSLVLLALTLFVAVEGGMYRLPPSKRSY